MTIALALGGGAGLGWAHIGVLRALQDAGVEVAAVAGTSIGALAAVCEAADRLDVLEALARSANVRTVLRYLDPHFRKGAVLGGRAITRQLRAHFGDRRLEDLRLPCAVVAADLVTGAEVAISSGDTVEAVRASMALPGLFAPVQRDGMVLVDGGVVAPVPVAAVRRLSDRPVVAVNLQADYARRAIAVGLKAGDGVRTTTVGITRAAMGLLLSQVARQSLTLSPPDLEIMPAVGHIDVRNFTRAGELIDIGRAATEALLPQIRALAAA
jgi:NTE family protein